MFIKNEGVRRLLQRPGTNQAERAHPALQPDQLKLLELEPEDWIIFAFNFSKHVPFFETKFPDRIVGTWKLFFEELLEEEAVPTKGSLAYSQLKEKLQRKLKTIAESGEMQPHLGLMLTFFKLMDVPKKTFNQLPKRHLDFYYKEILQFKKKPIIPDKVNLVFEVANHTAPKVPKGTGITGVKDNFGKAIRYLTSTDFFPNQAYLAGFKNRYTDKDKKLVRISQVASSLDGQGSDFSGGNESWWPFGHPEENIPLKDGQFGFLLSLEDIRSDAGIARTFILDFDFDQTFKNSLSPQELAHAIEVTCTGENGWLSLPLQTSGGFHSHHGSKQIRVVIVASAEMGGIISYDESLHDELPLSFKDPVLAFRIRVSDDNTYEFARSVSENPLKQIRVRSRINGIKHPSLSNDLGILQPEKPFMPFGAMPRRGSGFYLKFPGLSTKRVTYLKLNLTWENFPENIATHYEKYKEITEDYFTYDLSVKKGQSWSPLLEGITLFDEVKGGKASTNLVLGSLSKNQPVAINEGLKLTLKQSFFHEQFPRLYALAMTKKNPKNHVPNEPYTPIVGEVSIDIATDKIYSETNFEELHLWLFDDFGAWPESPSLKSEISHALPKHLQLLNFPGPGGELFIGIHALKEGQQLSLLFQLREGSENPDQKSFGSSPSLTWSILVNHHWIPLQPSEILLDGTKGLLQSGIIRFQFPNVAFKEGSRMEGGGVWLRVSTNMHFDAYSQFITILPQAEEAVYDGNNQDLGHLENGLPAGSITKMESRIAGIKGVEQPFSTFGGRGLASDERFYIQKSERLRHKNRAISLWDMERLVLQHFPEVHRVKCLNHSHSHSFLAPGHVMIVVVPDTVNKNVHDIFKPSLGQSTLQKIKEFLLTKCSPHVKVEVTNPGYEEVSLKLKVKFSEGKDKVYHYNQLQQDLVEYLSPWTKKEKNAMEFGVNVQESLVIHYIEKLPYVDYLKELVMEKDKQPMRPGIYPKNPFHILVSAKSHNITII